MDPRLLEHFKEITNILKNREEPVDIFLISNKLNLSIKQSKILLNQFISQGELLSDYMVFFSAEVIESNKIKSVIVPSNSIKLKEILNLKENLLDFGVYAIFKKDQTFMMNDYSIFCHDNKIIENIPIEKKVKIERMVENKSSNKVNSSNNISVNKTLTVDKISVQKSLTNEKNLAQSFNTKVNITKEKVDELKSSYVELDVIKNKVDEVNLEENYYGGPIKKEDKMQLPIAEKRKHNFTEEPMKDTKKKKEVQKPISKNKDFSSDSEGESKIKNHIVDKTEESSSLPQKIKKIRKIKKTNTYQDDKGYMRTIDEWEDEEYWTDEKPKFIPQNNQNFAGNLGKKTQGKKPASGQSNLMSFFKK